MAVDRADKENLPPSTDPAPAAAAAAAAAAVARLHGVVGVKRCKLKRLGAARRRVPLKDITNLFVVESAAARWRHALPPPPQQQQEGAEQATAVKAEPAAQNGLAVGSAVKAARYSLRKEFR